MPGRNGGGSLSFDGGAEPGERLTKTIVSQIAEIAGDFFR